MRRIEGVKISKKKLVFRTKKNLLSEKKIPAITITNLEKTEGTLTCICIGTITIVHTVIMIIEASKYGYVRAPLQEIVISWILQLRLIGRVKCFWCSLPHHRFDAWKLAEIESLCRI